MQVVPGMAVIHLVACESIASASRVQANGFATATQSAIASGCGSEERQCPSTSLVARQVMLPADL